VKTLNVSHSISSLKNRTFHRNNSSPYLDGTMKKSFSHERKSNILKSSSLKSLSKKVSKDKPIRQDGWATAASFKKALKPLFRDNYFLGSTGKLLRANRY